MGILSGNYVGYRMAVDWHEDHCTINDIYLVSKGKTLVLIHHSGAE